MMWQDFVFLIGSMTSVVFLYPTLKSTASQVPRATSIPSMLIGGAYSVTFFTLGMTFSATGAFAACTMWSLIAAFRPPEDKSLRDELQVDRLLGPIRRLGGDWLSATGPSSSDAVETQDRPEQEATAAPHSD